MYRPANGIYIPKSFNLQHMDSLSLFTFHISFFDSLVFLQKFCILLEKLSLQKKGIQKNVTFVMLNIMHIFTIIGFF